MTRYDNAGEICVIGSMKEKTGYLLMKHTQIGSQLLAWLLVGVSNGSCFQSVEGLQRRIGIFAYDIQLCKVISTEERSMNYRWIWKAGGLEREVATLLWINLR